VHERLKWWRHAQKERDLTTAVLVFLTLSLGVCIGFVLCSVITVASEEQRRAEHARIPDAGELEPESRPSV
jgi:hypothetical protein